MDIEDFNNLRKSDKPLLIDFYAEWCGPCKALAPQIIKLKELVGDSANIIKVDIDKPLNRSLVYEYNIQSVPTLIILHNEVVKWRHTGILSAPQIADVLKGIKQLH